MITGAATCDFCRILNDLLVNKFSISISGRCFGSRFSAIRSVNRKDSMCGFSAKPRLSGNLSVKCGNKVDLSWLIICNEKYKLFAP